MRVVRPRQSFRKSYCVLRCTGFAHAFPESSKLDKEQPKRSADASFFRARRCSGGCRRVRIQTDRGGHAAAHGHNAEKGLFSGGRPPLGYRVVPAADQPRRKRLELNPAEVPIVQEIFERRLKGDGARTIEQDLNDRGQLNRSRLWSKTTVLSLLRFETTIGNVVFGKKDRRNGRWRPREQWIIVPSHPPIIDMDLWKSVQTLMDQACNPRESGSPHSLNLFTGLLRCGYCGSTLQIETAKGRSRRYSYYGCRRRQKGHDCEQRRMPAPQLDEFLIDTICAEVFSTDTLGELIENIHERVDSWAKDRERKISTIDAAVRAIESRNDSIFDAIETQGSGTPRLADLTRRLRANNTKLVDLERQL